MKRRLLIIMALIMILLLASCGSPRTTEESPPSQGSGSAGQSADSSYMDEEAAPGEYGEAVNGSEQEGADGDAVLDKSSGLPGGGFALSPEQKIIFTGDISLETEKFDETMAKIDLKVRETGSYIESSSLSGTGKSEYDLRYASMVLRVPKDRFEQVLKAAEEWGTVISSNTSSQDVTRQYIDTEARIKTLKVEEERLLLLLGKAEKLEDIIVLEGRLSDIRLQIESYTGTLQQLDALVDYATISVMVREVRSETYVPQNFGQRLLETIRSSLRQLGLAIENAIVALIYLLPYIILAAIIAIVIKKKGWAGKLLKRKSKKDGKESGGDQQPK